MDLKDKILKLLETHSLTWVSNNLEKDISEIKLILCKNEHNNVEPNYNIELSAINGAWMNSEEKKSFDNYKKVIKSGSTGQ